MPKRFSPELRERDVRMVIERQALEGGPGAESVRAVAPIPASAWTLRIWCNRYGPAEPTTGVSGAPLMLET